jgi:hypothetical protein
MVSRIDPLAISLITVAHKVGFLMQAQLGSTHKVAIAVNLAVAIGHNRKLLGALTLFTSLRLF